MDQVEAAEALLKGAEKYLKCACTVGGCPICEDGGWFPNPAYVRAARALGMEIPKTIPAQATFMGTLKLKPDAPGGTYTVFVDQMSDGAQNIHIEDHQASYDSFVVVVERVRSDD